MEVGMKALVGCAMVIIALAPATSADAKGCIKGALIGGVAGHYAGHHGLLGQRAVALLVATKQKDAPN
jgi:hypothetical protein